MVDTLLKSLEALRLKKASNLMLDELDALILMNAKTLPFAQMRFLNIVKIRLEVINVLRIICR